MPDDFIPLTAFFRVQPVEPDTSPAPEEAGEPAEDVRAGAFAAARRFHAALADALDAALDRVLRDVAREVLGRELAIAPADVAAIAARALERYAGCAPVRLRANPAEVHRLATHGLPVVADSNLNAGDVALDVRDGTIDATLAARLESLR